MEKEATKNVVMWQQVFFLQKDTNQIFTSREAIKVDFFQC